MQAEIVHVFIITKQMSKKQRLKLLIIEKQSFLLSKNDAGGTEVVQFSVIGCCTCTSAVSTNVYKIRTRSR